MNRSKITHPFLVTVFILLPLTGCDEGETPVAPVVDHIAPAVEWISPESGAELSGVIEIAFSVFDEFGIDRACVYINGSLFGEGGHSCLPPDNKWDRHSCLSFCTDTLFTLSWNTLDFDDGVYILEARAWDDSGNLGTSPSLLVNVRNGDEPPPEDHLPPDVWWTAPDPGSTLADTVRLRLRVFDEGEVDSVLLLKNGAAVATILPPCYCRGDSTNFPPYYCRGDSTNIPPYYCGGGQRGGQVTCTGEITSNATYDKPVQQAVQATRRKTESNPPLPPPSIEGGDGEGSVDYLWHTRTDSDGVYVWEARAWDEAGNMGTSPALLVRVKNNPEPPPEDRSPPVVSWCSPEPGDTLEGTVELRFQALDDVGVDSVKVYLNGREWQNLEKYIGLFLFDVIWITCEYPDGNYIVQVKAWDCSQNVGMSEVIWFHVWNNRPRVIWVPDDYEKIQDAINASEDGDTVRVRSGIYYEMIYFWDKNTWLESEEGPETTVIDVRDHTWGLKFDGGQDTTAGVRGFTIQNSPYLAVYCATLSSPKIVNNIFFNSGQSALRNFINRSVIRNNIFSTARQGVELNLSFGEFDNNIVIHCERWALWNSYFETIPIIPDYNLIYDYDERTNNPPIRFGVHNIFDIQPRFVEGSYMLSNDSPCIDSGRPDLRDLDGSRSDIGVYGGPYAYKKPNN